MTNDQFLNLIAIFAVAFIVFVIVIRITYTRQQRAKRIIKRKKKNGRNRLFYAYKFYRSFPLTKRTFQRVRDSVSGVYPADEISVDMRSTSIMLQSTLIAIGAAVFTIIIGRSDLFYILLGLTLVYILFTLVLNTRINAMESKLLDQFSTFLSQVRNNYERNGRVDDSVGDLIESLPYEMSLHATIIDKVLRSTNVINAAEDYADISPNRYFTTFVEICATTIEYGDKKMPDGGSMFERNVSFLKEEVNNEMLRRQTNSAQFAGLSAISIAPAFFVKLVSDYWISNIPDMAQYYNGFAGVVSMVIVFAVSIACYQAINYLKDPKRVRFARDEGISQRIGNWRPVRRMIDGQVKKKYTKALRTEEMLQMTGDRLGIRAFVVRRWLTAVVVGIFMTVMFATSVGRGRHQILTDFTNAYQSSSVTNQELKDTMIDVAASYLSNQQYIDEHAGQTYTSEDREELITDIEEHTTITDRRYASPVADLIIERLGELAQQFFKWWYVVLILGSMAIGYMIPYLILLFKQQSVKMDMDDEVVQFQTIVLMLMHVDGCNVEMLLEWMDRFSFCFRQPIETCISQMPMKGQQAIQELYESETYPSFQNFIGNLLNVDNVGVEQAFSGIESERQFYKEKRREDNMELLQKKSNIAMLLCFAPLVVLLVGHFVLPVAQYAMSELSIMTSAFG